MERAGSIGRVSAWPRRTPLVSAGGGGGRFPRPQLRRNQRLMIPSGPPRPPDHGFPLTLRPTSFQRAKVLLRL
ncbi:MAG: hypothetical protein FJ117_17820 [Deltaproteobacteria bacterium]|nr:hypothetical protein [Deltaproteobacteria bacterium]